MSKLKKRPDGRYVKTMTDPRTGKRVYFYGETEREINRKIMEFSGRAQRGRTFQEVSDEWWEDAEPKLAMQSIRGYKAGKAAADEAFGERLVKEITPRDISRYLEDLARCGYSQKTVSGRRMVLNRILSHAVLECDLIYNPCASVSTPKDLPKNAWTAATEEDERIVRESAALWIFPYFALMTGMRKGEILALQWRDIDFEHDLIRVTKSVSHNGDRPVIKRPKTEAGNRIVPLLAPLKNTLLSIPSRKADAYIVSDTGATPLTNRRYITLFDKFRAQTGVHCTAHQLRHSFATIAFEADLDPKTVQEILGHKQLSTTMDIYTSFREKALTAAAKKLNSVM